MGGSDASIQTRKKPEKKKHTKRRPRDASNYYLYISLSTGVYNTVWNTTKYILDFIDSNIIVGYY